MMEKPDTLFGQELLTQELITFDQVHVNVSQSLIVTTDDRMHIWLADLLYRAKTKQSWIAPLGLVAAITLSLTTADFKNFILPSATWQAIFVIMDIISCSWLLISLRQCYKKIDAKSEIENLKTFSPRDPKGRQKS